MNNVALHKNFILFGVLYIIFAGLSLFFNSLWFYGCLLCILFAYLFIQHPKIMFWLMICTIPFSIEYNFSDSIGTDFPDEFFMIATLFVSIFIFLNKKSHSLNYLSHNILFSLIVYQIIWTAIATYHSQVPILSLKFLASKIWYIIPFVIVPQWILQTKNSFRILAASIVIPVLLVSLLVLIKHSEFQFSFVSINDCVKPFFRNHVGYAATLSFTFSVVLCIFIFYRNNKNFFLLLLSLLILLVALYFSYTRGSWLSVLLSIPFYIALYMKRIKHLLIASSVLIVLVVGFFIIDDNYLLLKPDFEKAIVHENLSEHIDAMYEMNDISVSERVYRWVAGFKMSIVHPIVGFGPSTFYATYKSYTDKRFRTYVSANPERSTLHNYFLLTFIEQGFIGLLLLLGIIFTFFYKCQQLFHQTKVKLYKTILSILCLIMANIIVINFFSDMIETDKVGTMYFLCIGTLIFVENKIRSDESLA